jgi:hypothetical protein
MMRSARVERGWVMRGLLPWNRAAEEVSAVAVAVQAKWVFRKTRPDPPPFTGQDDVGYIHAGLR